MSNEHRGGSYQADGLQRVKVWDEITVAEVDRIGYLVVIDELHHKIHEGKLFQIEHYDTDSDGGDTTDTRILLKVGSKEVHFEFLAVADTEGELILSEAPTASDNGTSLTINNRDRTSTLTSEVSAYYGPTITGDGLVLADYYLPATQQSTGQTDSREEWILAPNTDYMVRFTPSSDNANVSIHIDFYEIEV